MTDLGLPPVRLENGQNNHFLKKEIDRSEAPGSSKRLQEAPGGSRRLQGGSRKLQEAPGGSPEGSRSPGGSRKLQEAPGRLQEAPGRSREATGRLQEAPGGFHALHFNAKVKKNSSTRPVLEPDFSECLERNVLFYKRY